MQTPIINMQGIPENVRQEFVRLVPASILPDVTCFVFYDYHPRDEKHIDITVCTKNGEIREYFQRDLISSIDLQPTSTPNQIMILRSSEAKLFYLVVAEDELLIVSSGVNLSIHSIIKDVAKFTITNTDCKGQISLKVHNKSDLSEEGGRYILLNDSFRCRETLLPESDSDCLPIINELKRKYIQAQYSNKNYEVSKAELTMLRYTASSNDNNYIDPSSSSSQLPFLIYPNHENYSFKQNSEVDGALKIQTRKPFVKVCNKKLIIALKVLNQFKVPLDDVHILLRSATVVSLTYTTKLFENINTEPFWREKQTQQLTPDRETSVVAVVDLEKCKESLISRIALSVGLSYKAENISFVMPFEDIFISSIASLGDDLNVLSSCEITDVNIMLAIMSTSVKTDLQARIIRNEGDDFMELLIEHVDMERVGAKLILYRKSPYHALNGTMLHFLDITDQNVTISVYTSSLSQVLALIHLMYDIVPSKIIILPLNYEIIEKVPENSNITELISDRPEKDYSRYAQSILERTKLILEYLDASMVQMSASKDQNIRRKVGYQIDLYGSGKDAHKEFMEKMLAEAEKGVNSWMKGKSETDGEAMVVE